MSCEEVKIKLSKVFVYPIKALPAVELETVRITEGGALYNDRRWGIVDRKGRMVNGKNNKRLFSLKPTFDLELETVSFLEGENTRETFDLANLSGLSKYFSKALKQPVFLKENKKQGFPDDITASGPTVVTQASLETVSSWYPDLSLDDIRARFRVNLELSPAPAFWEDGLFKRDRQPKSLQIGDVFIHVSNPCARCSVPIKHPDTGEPYNNFYETFIAQREQTRPDWLDPACFDHWYRLSLNTNIGLEQAKKALTVGDAVKTYETPYF